MEEYSLENLFKLISKEVVVPLGHLNEDMEIVKNKLNEYWGVDFPVHASGTQSPRQLNDLGKTIEKELNKEILNFPGFLDLETISLNTVLDENKIEKTPYNIQNQAFKMVNNSAYKNTPKNKKALEQIAYNHGNDLRLIKEVLGLLVRDHYFEKYNLD